MEIFGLTILESNRDFGGKWGREKKQCYLDLKVVRIWGMLKSIRWLILISQIRIVRLILEIIREPGLHRQSKFSRRIPGPATSTKTKDHLDQQLIAGIPDFIHSGTLAFPLMQHFHESQFVC